MMASAIRKIATGFSLVLMWANATTLTKNPTKSGCGPLAMIGHRRASAKLHQHEPGAGISSFTPYQESFKDGYFYLDCIKDYLHLHGDKFGDNKHDYELGTLSNVSIVRYTDTITKEDRETMTHDVCFAFCRTVPDMLYFGITNGRDCYCMPYSKAVAGDSSQCDMPCDGNPTEMCGGKSKSAIFEMHVCNDAAGNLATAKSSSEAARNKLEIVVNDVTFASGLMQGVAADLQKAFGKVGDQATAANLQSAKEFAGNLEHAASAGRTLVTEMETLEATNAAKGSAAAMEASSEALEAKLLSAVTRAKTMTADLTKLKEVAHSKSASGDSGKLYYPALYFVDKDFVESPSTCGGEAAAKPKFTSFEGCADACEALPESCVGYSFLPAGKGGLCFLFSKMKSITYYTGCNGPSFLQRKDAAATKCVVKFAKFDGTTLKPNPNGKCDNCLDSANKADRCFE